MAKLSGDDEFGFWDKLKYLFSNPNFFFEKVKSEDGIKNALLMYSIVGAFMASINFIFSFMYLGYMGRMIGGYGEEIYSFLMPLYAFGGVAVGIIITFLYSGLIHAIIIAFKGEGSYSDTYKVYTYSMIPFLILTAVPIVGYLSIIYSFTLMIIGISKLHNISKGKSALACLLPAIFILGILIFLVIMLLMNIPGSMI